MLFRFCILTILVFSSCASKNDNHNYRNNSRMSFNLVKQCVDTLLNASPSMNTINYVLDVSYYRDTLNRKGIDSFLNLKESLMAISSDDSVIVFENGDANKFHMKQSMVIKFDSILSRERNRVVVKARKIKSWQEIVEATIELKRKGWGYEIRKFQQTN